MAELVMVRSIQMIVPHMNTNCIPGARLRSTLAVNISWWGNVSKFHDPFNKMEILTSSQPRGKHKQLNSLELSLNRCRVRIPLSSYLFALTTIQKFVATLKNVMRAETEASNPPKSCLVVLVYMLRPFSQF